MRTRLPLTVISGYLGAGKTTLINRLLAEPHGLRLMVMVNDFGAINIDADLLEAASEDTLTLTNGCVCCTMGADLFMAIGDVLDRADRPDHLVIEASGIADPARIVNVAHAEPELSFGGVVTVVEAATYGALAEDPQIGPQIRQQTRAADLVVLSKSEQEDPALMLRLAVESGSEVIDAGRTEMMAPLILGLDPAAAPQIGQGHDGAYVSWSFKGDRHMTRDGLERLIDARPEGLVRFKGFVDNVGAGAWEVQCVGPSVGIKPLSEAQGTRVVGIGLKGRVTPEEMAVWWGG